MSVELINHNPNEVLDLTGGSDENQENEEQAPASTDTDDSIGSDGELTKASEDGESEDSDSASDDDSSSDSDAELEGSEEEGESDESEYFFGEQQVHVEVPDEIASALKEAGVDQKELLGQLFKKDGDFSLDEATRTKLEDKFGKLMVDGYLNMYKGINSQTLEKVSSDKEAQAATEAQEGKAYSEAVGGEEGLLLMEDYIIKNFDESQIAAYNAVMENGDHASQMLIISQTKQLQAMADKLVNGDKSVSLIGEKDANNNGVSSPLDKGYLTNAEYNSMMNDDKYWTDKAYMNKVDAARMAGFKHDA